MGTNCAPYLANIFLHMYEIEFIAKLNAECKHRVSVLLKMIALYLMIASNLLAILIVFIPV